jgi:hypothetical protein
MATVFAATKLTADFVGTNYKRGVYKIQMPNPTTSGGDTWDISGEFDFVQGFSMNISGVVTDNAYKYSLVGGTFSSAGLGYPAATVKIVAHQSAGSAAAMAEASSVDLSAVDDAIATVWGT